MTQDRTMTDEPLPTDRDDLHDRLLDRALRERVGGEKAPDLSEKIVAAARPTSPASYVRTRRSLQLPPTRWISISIAASILVVIGAGLLIPAFQAPREAARRAESTATIQPLSREVERNAGSTLIAPSDPNDVRMLRENALAAGDEEMMMTPRVIAADDAGDRRAGEGEGAASPDFDSLSDLVAPTVQPESGAGQQQAEIRYGASAPTAAPVMAESVLFGPADGRPGPTANGSARMRFQHSVGGVAIDSSGSMVGGEVRFYGGGPQQHSADLEVMKQVAMMHASSSSGLEAAVAAEMDKDPTISMYKEQLFVLDQQIQELAAESRNPGEPQLSSLKGQYAQAEEMMRQYRTNAEREARGRLQGSLEEVRRARIEEMVRRERERRSLGDNYAPIVDNPFRTITADSAENRLSTFSIDVDTASYANVRQFLMQSNMLPPPDAVRIEELVNYFTYDYAGPGESDEPVARNAAMMEARMAAANRPFAANIEVAACPWAPKHRLVRFGIKGREVARAARPKSNLVFLVDVSGSMDDPQKLPLLIDGMRMLTQELGENDRVAIVVYASTEGLALESTRGDQQEKILAALDRLSAGGSTAGGAGIQLAYKVAADNFIEGGTNRVILCTDGDFNVGVTDVEALKQLAADKAKDTGVFLTVLGFGRGNLNDELMEAVADNGNGAYHYVDNRSEARKVLVEQMTGTLVTIAKDVKIQVEFNPTQVAAYRLIGYENRVLAAEDFNNDAKDAGEIGAGHTVTALYEIVPIGEEVATTNVDELKYAPVTPAGDPPAEAGSPDVDDQKYSADAEASSELLTLKIRYKQPDGDTSTKLEFPVTDAGLAFSKASSDFQFASSVAGFGMLLRGSPYKGDATFAGMLEIAESSVGNEDPHGYRREFTQVIAKAKQLSGE
jgi:Ca-activated chloride channel family protein